MKPEDLCPRPAASRPTTTQPLAPAIELSSVYRCETPAQADDLLAGREPGYVYRRDAHPNADQLAELCQQLHAADWAAVCSSGMAALAAIVLAELAPGDEVVVSNQLYGRSLTLLTSELARLGIVARVVDTCDLAAVEHALTAATRLVFVETITNPLLRVSAIAELAALAHAHGARLAVDNTFASPAICRPLDCGADLVWESLTKIMNGHSDVLLGLVCGRGPEPPRLRPVLSTWGLSSSPFDCWLAHRGLGTLALRAAQASANALAVARFLVGHPQVERVDYPGLPQHADHALARRQFDEQFGSIVTFTLRTGVPGPAEAATRFIRAATRIPFSPSLGELCTTLSHPASTSHRALSAEARTALGMSDATIRLSVGIESAEFICQALDEALGGTD